jgi:branched-chain amino acid transport system ATP-binding protein
MTALQPLLDVHGSLLSHFERRRLTVAMAIAGRPRILLLDEPLAGLDDSETHLLKDCIHDIHRQLGCTLLLIEHKLGVVMRLCSQLTVLDYGQVISEGDPETVSRDAAVIQAYLGS